MHVSGTGHTQGAMGPSTAKWISVAAGITGLALLALGFWQAVLVRHSAPISFQAVAYLSTGWILTYLASWILEDHQPPRPRDDVKITWTEKRSPQMSSQDNSPTISQLEMLQRAEPYRHILRAPKKEAPQQTQAIAPEWCSFEYLSCFLEANVRCMSGQRLAYLSGEGKTCFLNEGTEIGGLKEQATAVCRTENEIFFGTVTCSILHYTTSGQLLQSYQLRTEYHQINHLSANHDYLVAHTCPNGRSSGCSHEKNFTIIERHSYETLGTIEYRGHLNSKGGFLCYGEFFFHYKDALERIELSSGKRSTFSLPEECGLSLFLGVWREVAFLDVPSKALYLIHYPSQKILNRVEYCFNNYTLGTLNGNDSKLNFLGAIASRIDTLEWIFDERKIPKPNLLDSSAPCEKGKTIDEEAPDLCRLLSVPQDVLLSILHYLDPHSLVSASGTCTTLRNVSKLYLLWAGRLGLFQSSYSLYMGDYFRETPIQDEISYPEIHSTLHTSLFSPHVIRFQNFASLSLQIDSSDRLDIVSDYFPEAVGLYGSLLSFYTEINNTIILNVLDLEKQEYLFTNKVQSYCPGWQHETFTYLGNANGEVIRFATDGSMKVLEVEDEKCMQIYADSTHLIYGMQSKVLRLKHCNLEPIPDTCSTLQWKQTPLWYHFNSEALFYQDEGSPLYVFLFESRKFRKFKTYGRVRFLDTQGSVLMMRENWSLVLLNYRTGERLNTIPMDPKADAKLYGSQILVESAGKSLTLSWGSPSPN